MITKNKYLQYQYVVAYLQQQGIKQNDLAKSIGKSNTYVSWLVKDKRKNKYIQPDILKKIADYFDLTVDQLLEAGKAVHNKNNPQSAVKPKDNSKITQIHLHIHINGKEHVFPA